MATSPRDELADELLARLHDPDKYVERGMVGNKREPLKMHQLRAIMEYFEDVQRREVNGQMVIAGRSRFRPRNPDMDGE